MVAGLRLLPLNHAEGARCTLIQQIMIPFTIQHHCIFFKEEFDHDSQ